MAHPKEGKTPLICMIGRQIRLARNIKTMTLDQLAKPLGITYQQLQKYEKGINRISAARLFEVSQILDQPITFFYDGVIHDLAHHIGYPELKTAFSIYKIQNKEIKLHLVNLVDQMRIERV